MTGEMLKIRNYTQWVEVHNRVHQRLEMNPARVFEEAMPNVLGAVTENMGAWKERQTERWSFYDANEDGRAIGPDERAREGELAEKHIVALPGFEIAGPTHLVRKQDFLYSGMNLGQASERAARPRLSWNQKVAKILMDVLTQGAFSDANDDFSDDFAWTAEDQDGRTVTKNLFTDTASEVPDVVANSTQTITWPLRTGGETATGHDHLFPSEGANWTQALAAPVRDTIVEHPNNGRVRALCGANVIGDVIADAKSEFGAIKERIPLIEKGTPDEGAFGVATFVAPIDSIDYFWMPDMPDDIAVYYASNKSPLYASIGEVNAMGDDVGTKGWSEMRDPERGGVRYGYRDYFNAGIRDPTAIAIAQYQA